MVWWRLLHNAAYLDEFTFRYNRRFYRHTSFETLLGLAARHKPASYWDIIQRDNPARVRLTARTYALHEPKHYI